MKFLCYIDGFEWSLQALRYVARHRDVTDRLVLLHTVLRASVAELESGRRALGSALRSCCLAPTDPELECRLGVGDPASRLLAVCQEECPDLLAVGGLGGNEFPYLTELGRVARTVSAGSRCPVLLASPRGIELLLVDERLLIHPALPRLLPDRISVPTSGTRSLTRGTDARG
jgi:nucleotide-binding universal stress UspA family protein